MSFSVRSYGLVSILDAVVVFFIALYPILLVSAYLVMGLATPTLTVGFFGALLGIITFLALESFETHLISGRITISGLLYPVGCSFFIAAIVSTSIKVSRRREIKWKDSGYVQSGKAAPE